MLKTYRTCNSMVGFYIYIYIYKNLRDENLNPNSSS